MDKGITDKLIKSGIKGIAGKLNFDNNEVNLKLSLAGDVNSDIVKQWQNLVGKPSADGLKLMPRKLTMLYSTSINGEELMKVSEMSRMLDNLLGVLSLPAAPFKDAIMTVNGPLSVGIANVQNSLPHSTLTIMSKNPSVIFNLFKTLIPGGSEQGGTYTCNIFGSPSSAGVQGQFFYAYCGAKDEGSAYDDPLKLDLLKRFPSCLLIDARADSELGSAARQLGHPVDMYLELTSSNAIDMELKLVIEQPTADNSLQALLQLMPQSSKF